MSKFKLIAIVAVFASITLLAGGDAFAKLTATANHDHITIDFFYHGGTVSVRGVSDAGTDLVIKIESPEGHQVMKKKGKVAGFLWMNVGKLSFEQTPNLYEVFSTKPLDDILTPETLEKNTLGFPALAKHVEIKPAADDAEKATWFGEFVKFKQDAHLYSSSTGEIKTTAAADNSQEYYILTQWPFQASPGDYTVTVYAVKDKKIVEQATATVNVAQVGVVKTLATMAKNSAAFYGILSVGIALGAGFGVGLIFRKSGGAH